MKEVKPPKKVRSWIDLKGWMNAWSLFMYPQKVVLISMQLHINKHIHFWQVIHERTFVRDSCEYIIDEQAMYYNETFKAWCLDYHEGISIPLRKPTYQQLQQAVKNKTDITATIDAYAHKVISEANVIKSVVAGTADTQKGLLLILLWVSVGLNLLIALILFSMAGGIGGIFS